MVPNVHPRRRRAHLLALVATVAALLVLTPVARASDAELHDELTTIMAASGADTYGFLVQEVGGAHIAGRNAGQVMQPASSLKALVALHALQQVQAGLADLDDDTVPRYSMDGSCPFAVTTETETLETAIRLMMRISDNSSTHALVMHFGVDAVNATAAAAGLTSTKFRTMADPPGYHKLGCSREDTLAEDPPRVEGNTSSLADLAALYGGVAQGLLLQGDARDDFSRLTTGRQMVDDEGFDFFGFWPEILAIAAEERPADVTDHEFGHFVSRLDEHAKGGSYRTNDPFLRWASFSGILEVPECVNATVVERTYSLGLFFDRVPGANQAALDAAFVDARKAMARTLLGDALGGWGACATPATLDVVDTTVAYDGSPKSAPVTSDPAGVPVSITYTKDGSPVAQPTDAGTYQVQAAADPAEYDAAPATGTLTITPAPLTVTGPDVTRLYGADDPALTPAVTGLQGDDTVADLGPLTCTTSATSTSPAGTYPVTCSGVTNGNYSVTYEDGTLVVTYDVGRLQRPIDDPAGDSPTHVERGATLPVKFDLLGADAEKVPVTLASERAAACGLQIAIVPAGAEPPAQGTCATHQTLANRFHTNMTTAGSSPGDHLVVVWIIAADGTPAGQREVPIRIV